MFKLEAPTTIPATLTIVGQGREQKLVLAYRFKEPEAYAEMFQSIADGKLTVEDAILDIVESWEADGELGPDSIKKLRAQQPGADWAILTGYADAMTVARKGN